MAALADQYDDFAVISSTLGVHDGRVCVGEATRGDIGCPTYAPYVATDGSISATRFVGDGSGLFNIAGASADRIVSGTTSMLAISNTGYISVTQSGVNTAYFHPSMGLVTVGVSSTGAISGTRGYFNNSVPGADTLNVKAAANDVGIAVLNSSNSYVIARLGQEVNSQGRLMLFTAPSSVPGLSLIAGGNSYISNKLLIGSNGTGSTTLHVFGTALTTSWTGVNFGGVNVTPSAPLEVSGTVSATRFVGDGSGLTNIAGASADRIVSGTTSMLAISNTGYISVTQSGVNTAYFHPSMGLVTVGVSSTGGISGTTGYFSQKSFFGENASALAGSVSASHIISGTLYMAPSMSYASSNDGFLTIRASTGGSFFVGRQAGGGYASNKGIFTASTDNSNGAANLFFMGLTSGTTTSFIRADGLAYFASKLGVGVASPSTANAMEVSGTVSATRFVGDGSGLFNIAGASADRIVSGTTSMLAISDTGYISVTQSGVNTAYFHPSMGLVTVGVSSTGGISGTTGYFSGNVGIGTTAPSATLHVSGTGRFSGDVTTNGSLIGYNFYLPGMNDFIGGSGVSTNHHLKFVTSNTEAMRIVSTGYVGIGTATPKVSLDIGNNNFRLGGEGQYIGFNGYYNTSAGSWRNVDANTYVGAIRMGMSYANQGGDLQFYTQRDPTTNSTNDTNLSVYQRMIIRRSGDVRIGYGLHVGDTSFATTPTTALEVSGTVSATVLQVANTAPDSACASTSDLGKMRRNPTTGRMQVCR